MPMYRVTTTLTGPSIVGGGSSEMYFDAAVGTALDAKNAVAAFWTGLTTWILTGHSAAVSGAVETVNELNGEVTAVAGGVAGSTIAFTRTGTVMPPHVQGLIAWRTGVYNDRREIRGRTFIPALTQDLGNVGLPTAAYLTQLASVATTFVTAASVDPVIWRRPRKARPQVGQPSDPWFLPSQTQRDGAKAVIILGTPWTQFASLRSRRD